MKKLIDNTGYISV